MNPDSFLLGILIALIPALVITCLFRRKARRWIVLPKGDK